MRVYRSVIILQEDKYNEMRWNVTAVMIMKGLENHECKYQFVN